jgi:mannosylfructose-phosphate synthase
MMISTHGYVAAEPEFGKPDTGGQVVYILELSKCLARMGYAVDILTRRFEDQPFVERIGERIRVLRFPCGGGEFIPKEYLSRAIPEWVENVARWIKLEMIQYKLINSHYWDAGLAGQALANRFDVPHVHTPHSIGSWKRDNMGLDAREMEKKYNFRERIREEKVIYDECDLLIATTPAQRDVLQGDAYDVPIEKIRVIPPGYDDQRFYPVSLSTRWVTKTQLGFEGPIILALGRMARNKGYDLLLQAMPTVFQRVADAKLLLAVGSTEPKSERIMIRELYDLAHKLRIADRVIFNDFIPDGDLANYYRAADVFALSSRYEPFGMTAIEAMACGPEAFGHSIAAVLQHAPVAAQLAKFGPRKARSSFTWTGIAQQLLTSLETRRGFLLADLNKPNRQLDDYFSEEALWSA